MKEVEGLVLCTVFALVHNKERKGELPGFLLTPLKRGGHIFLRGLVSLSLSSTRGCLAMVVAGGMDRDVARDGSRKQQSTKSRA